MTATITVVDFGTPLYAAGLQLRTVVLRRPLGLEYNPDDLVEEWRHHHLAMLEHGRPVGWVTLAPLPNNTFKLRQMAVHPAYQHQGRGRLLIKAAERWARLLGARSLLLHARHYAVPFYQKMGFTVWSEPFTEVGMPHYRMGKTLPPLSPINSSAAAK